MLRNFESSHIIHPVTLDSCLQSASLALTGIGLEFSTLYVPTYVKNMAISHGIPKNPGHELKVYTTARVSESGKELEARSLVIDASNQGNQPMIEIDGFISSAMPISEYGDPRNRKRGLCFSTQYATCGLPTTAQYPAVFSRLEQESQGKEQKSMAERAAFYFARTALTELSSYEIQALDGHLESNTIPSQQRCRKRSGEEFHTRA